MNYYTADLHFNRISTFEKEKRSENKSLGDKDGNISMESVTEAIIKNINSRVSKYDTLYILGDVACFNYNPYRELRRIKCQKVLIIGNHDFKWLHDRKFSECFKEIKAIDTVRDCGKTIVLCHYPLADWSNSRKGWWHLYGHLHKQPDIAARPFMESLENAWNVGIDCNDYACVTMREIIKAKERRSLN